MRLFQLSTYVTTRGALTRYWAVRENATHINAQLGELKRDAPQRDALCWKSDTSEIGRDMGNAQTAGNKNRKVEISKYGVAKRVRF